MSQTGFSIATRLFAFLGLLLLGAASNGDPRNDGIAGAIQPVLTRRGTIGATKIATPPLSPAHQYSFLYSASPLSALTPETRITVEVQQGSETLASKILHAGDPDLYAQFRVTHAGPASVVIKTASNVHGKFTLQLNQWPLSSQVKAGPLHDWQHAQSIELGKTLFASGDDAEYIPLDGTARRAAVENPQNTDWYKFEFQENVPKLIHLLVELTDRDQVPVNVSLWRVENGKLQEFYEGEDPVTSPHEVQALPGNKFTTRIVKDKGTYYVSVRANHPEYKLRTRVYDPPPYKDPQQAVRTALDYILGAADSWHANTPRRGGILDRISSVHQETSLCVGCHTTHFPLRAQIYATRNGYPIVQRQQVQFLAERFYNNPRPFYGFENQASWARVISAPANVLGRMSHLMDLYEDQVTGERRESFHKNINGYLDLYYADRDKLPPDETNGNTPLVSAFEVAWYAWTSTHDARLISMVASGPVKNMIDLSYQTLALADMDREKFKDQIAKNAEGLFSLQRADGQWSMRFDPKEHEVEFQTGHVLWALNAAGIPASEPHVAKAIDYLLARQQSFGGWMDPLQSFENFRTPFRETQFAIVALSSYFPKQGRAKGWNSTPVTKLSSDPGVLLEQLDGVWDAPAPEILQQIEALGNHPDALIRQAAIETLGRLGVASPIPAKLLGDPSKLVQRTAAWAVRQRYSRHEGDSAANIVASLTSSDDRTRWGATRVFASHFAALAKRPEVASALARDLDDRSLTVRVQAVKALWQFWYWSNDLPTKSMIEDRLLASLGKPEPAWVESNLHHAIYNIADENIRYLYNNWVPLLGRQADRDAAIRGRLAVESRLADKFTTVLKKGSNFQKKALLASLTELPLRRADIYDLDADMSKSPPLVYNRIGNDIEQIASFGESREKIATALLPLVDAKDAELRYFSAKATLLVRDNKFADVDRIAGPAGAHTRELLAKMENSTEAPDVARFLKPAVVQPANAGIAKPKTGSALTTAVKLDEAYFRGYVEPLLQKRGRDGYACVHCHATHTLFDGTWGTVKNVVDSSDPENSLILRKPTSSSETEGIANSSTTAHGGGIRFAKGSPEYNTILDWIKGTKD